MANATYTFTQADGTWDYAADSWVKTSNDPVNNITSNALQYASDRAAYAWTSFTPTDADYGAECDFTVAATGHGSVRLGVGVVLNEVTPAATILGYFVRYNSSEIQLARRLGQYSETTIATFSVAASTSGKLGIKRVVNAGDVTLSVYFNDTLLEATPGDGYSFVDTDASRVTDVGRVGLYNGFANSGTIDNVYVDDAYDPAPANDDDPDPLTFNSKTDVPISTLQTSDPSTITGINVLTAFTVANGEAEINSSGSWVTSGNVSNNDSIKLRHTSSGSNSTAVVTTITFTVSGDTATFTSTTVASGGGGFEEPLYDVFVGSGELIETTASESGHYWTKKAGSLDLSIYQDGAQVSGTGRTIWHSVDNAGNPYLPASTDYKISVIYKLGVYSHSYLHTGIYVGVDNDYSGYYVRWNNGNWELIKQTDEYNNSVLDTIAAAGGSATDPATQDVTVTIGRAGNDVYLTVGGTTVTVTDTTWLSGGTIAVLSNYPNISGDSYLKSISATLEGQPQIVSVTEVREGESVTVTGIDFGTAGTLEIGGVVCSQTSYSDTSITATAPSTVIGYGSQTLKVTRTDTSAFGTLNIDYHPPTGWAYVALGADYADLPNRSLFYQVVAYNFLVTGDLIKYETAGNPSGTVSLDTNGAATIIGAPSSGNVAFDVAVLDASNSYQRQAIETVTLSESANTAPIFTGTIPTQTATSGAAFSFDFSSYFSDADGDTLTYTATGLQDGLSIVNSTITGTSTAAASNNTVQITAFDGRGGSVQSNSFTLQLNDGIGPVISNYANIEAVAAFTGEELTASSQTVIDAINGISGFDETDGAVSVTVTGLPATMTIAGSPYAFTATATDAATNQTQETGSLAIVLDSTPPVFDAFTTPQTITLNPGETELSKDDARVTAILDAITATDDYGTVNIVNDAPDVLAVSGSPYVINLFAIDQANNTASSAITLNIEADGVNNAPAFTSSSVLSVTQGQTVTHIVTATDADDNALTFSESGAWPAWANLVGDVITLTPDNTVAIQDYTITVNVTDGTANVTQQITISVASATFDAPLNRTAVWAATKLPILIVGDTFCQLPTLNHGLNSAPFDFSAATNVKVAVVNKSHTESLTSTVTLTGNEGGADWANGVLSLYIDDSVTAEMSGAVVSDELAKIEIQVTINNSIYTWHAPVLIRPGYIS